MNENLEKALEFSNYQRTLKTKQDNLKLRLEHMLLCKYNDYIFQNSKEIITFLSLFEKTIVIDDYNGIPVQINKPKELHKILIKNYQDAYSEYYTEYTKLKKARTIKKLTE